MYVILVDEPTFTSVHVQCDTHFRLDVDDLQLIADALAAVNPDDAQATMRAEVLSRYFATLAERK